MKKKSPAPLLVYVFAALVFMTGGLFGNDGKEVTVAGDAKCAKCALDETDQCQTAIEVTENGQKVVYYLENNDVAKAFHKNVCTATVKATATGTVVEKDGKHVMTASKIEKAG